LMAKAEPTDSSSKEDHKEASRDILQEDSEMDNGITIGTPSELAADGSLPRFFSGPGLLFDPENLRFKIEL